MKKNILLFIGAGFIFTSLHAQIELLAPGKIITKKLKKGEKHEYTVALQKGEYASCVVMQRGVDLEIDVIDPSGKKVQTFDSPNGKNGPEPVFIAGSEEGTYLLQIYTLPDENTYRSNSGDEIPGEYEVNSFVKLSVSEYKQKSMKDEADKILFAKWLADNAFSLKTVNAESGFEDMKSLKEIFKNVNVVGLGESSHGTSEFFKMKHRMLEFLVKEMGFSSFYIEASMSRCNYINQYVLYGKGNLDTATTIQGFYTWRVEEVRDMIEWIRQYNKNKPDAMKVKFLGYDLQLNDFAWQDMKQFYKKVNPASVSSIDSIYAAFEAIVMGRVAQKKLDSLSEKLYRQCLSILNDILLNNGRYQYVTGKKVYDENLMNIQLIVQEMEWRKNGFDGTRDYYMAQNIMNLLNQEKKNAKVVIWAHNGHIEKQSAGDRKPMGYYLEKYLKQKYYAVGFEFYSGSFQTKNFDIEGTPDNWDVVRIGDPPKESLPWYFNQTGKSRLFMDFRYTRADTVKNFSNSYQMHSFGSGYSPAKEPITTSLLLTGFDGMIYIKNSTAAKNFTKVKSWFY